MHSAKQRVLNFLAHGALRLALLLPYETRVRMFGWVCSRIFAPALGWRARVTNNLQKAMPELTGSERAELARTVPNNAGRTLIEMYSSEEFLQRAENAPIEGPGLPTLEHLHADGKPAVLVTAHFGSYDAARAALYKRGLPIAGLYKPLKNRAFNDHYLKAMAAIGEPVFPTDRRGILGLVRHLKAGGMIGILADVRSNNAPVLSFFGQPAHTALSAAEWAVQYDALMLPVFGIRQTDGFSFKIWVEEPIPFGAPKEMMQRYNDVVETFVRKYPSQWFWIHDRWKLAKWVQQSAKR